MANTDEVLSGVKEYTLELLGTTFIDAARDSANRSESAASRSESAASEATRHAVAAESQAGVAAGHAEQAGEDRVQTGADRRQTGEDRAQTGKDAEAAEGWAGKSKDAATLAITAAATVSQYVGDGFPEGKVSAPVGSIYVDRQATAGAVRWIKTSGDGSTGWQVEYGDTGWRTICRWDSGGVVTSGTLPSGIAPHAGEYTGGGVYLRRYGRMVYLGISEAVATSDSPTFECPIGFRGGPPAPYPAVPLMYIDAESGSPEMGIIEAGSGMIRLRGVPVGGLLRSGGSGGYAITASWLARDNDPWPLVYPGTQD